MKKVLFVLPVTYHAHLPHFRSRFQLLSRGAQCHILLMGDPSLDGERFQGGTLYVQTLPKKFTLLAKIGQALALIKRGTAIARQENVDLVLAYDPLQSGLVATIIKLLSGCRLIVEINGHYKNARSKRAETGRSHRVARVLYNLACFISLVFADAVKLLNVDQFEEWKAVLKHKPCFLFHDYVPTSLFAPAEAEGDYILCAGFPFRIKGVDVLLQAYSKIRNDFPGVRLVIMGHGREPELSRWRAKIEAIPGAELRKPVAYHEMPDMLRKCLILALPSRSEAMGRVLIEAMACGKAVVGSRVGGIPNLIQDGVNGWLAEPGDVDDLADKLGRLLASRELRVEMGQAGLRLSRTRFSEGSYAESFLAMLASVAKGGQSKSTKGIVFSIYR